MEDKKRNPGCLLQDGFRISLRKRPSLALSKTNSFLIKDATVPCELHMVNDFEMADLYDGMYLKDMRTPLPPLKKEDGKSRGWRRVCIEFEEGGRSMELEEGFHQD